jgi:sugar phosphate isomerase/epimerase
MGAAACASLATIAPAVRGQPILVDFAHQPVGLQLFTLFDSFDQDVKGNLQKIAKIGYRDLQSSHSKQGGIYGMTPKVFAAMVADLGMTWSSHHVSGIAYKAAGADKQVPAGRRLNLTDNMQELVDYLADGGPRHVVCAGAPTGTRQETDATIALLNSAGLACKKAGLSLSYHNHDTEFRRIGDTTPYEMILEACAADIVSMEIDIAWAVKGGAEPVALFKRYPGRFDLWHVKDIDASLNRPQALGQGIIDFRRIFEHAGVAGLKHYYVEHDFPADPFASIATSMTHLTQIFK